MSKTAFTYSVWGPFTRHVCRIQKFKETKDSRYIYRNELDKVCFQHYMTYNAYKDIVTKKASDEVLFEKAFQIANNPKNDRYQRELVSMVCKLSDKKPSTGKINHINNYLMNYINQSLKKFKNVNY